MPRRLHSRAELFAKLTRQQFSDSVVNGVLDDLKRLGYVDDEQFARNKAASAARRSSMKARKRLTVVLGIGTSSIVDEKTHEPILSILSLIVETAIKLRRDGHRVVIVSSGAIGVGLQRMNMPKRPKHLAQVQVRFSRSQERTQVV